MGQKETLPSDIADAPARNKVDEAKNMTRDIAQDAKRQGREKLDSGKERAANQTEKLAGLTERAAQDLRDSELQFLSDYAAQLAGGMRNLAESLRSKSIDGLLSDTQELARKNPALFFIGSIGVGLAFSRFLKASGERPPVNNQNRKYDSRTEVAVEPMAFESGPAVMPATGSPKPQSSDNPSFADDLKKGI